jgi:hypothetical protein
MIGPMEIVPPFELQPFHKTTRTLHGFRRAVFQVHCSECQLQSKLNDSRLGRAVGIGG